MSSTAPIPPALAASQPAPLGMGEVLRIPVMRRLWTAQIVSTFGDFLALFAVIGVLTFRLQATPQQITGLQIAYLLPIAILGVLAGVFVDRWPLKLTLVGSDLTRAVLCALLFFAHSLFAFYAILAAISVFSSFFGPAQGVTLRTAVPLHGLRSANALMQQVMFGMRIIGPGLATVLYTRFGPRACYSADALSFVASAALIGSLTLTRPAAEPSTPGAPPKSALGSILPDMRQGVSFIVHHAALLFVILALAAGMFVMGCFGPLIAIYVRDTLHGTPRIYGYASGAIGVGMFLGVNVLNTLGKNLKSSIQVYAGLLGIAVGLCFLAGLPQVWATITGTLIIGFAVAGIVVPSNPLIQQETPAPLMGRVGSTVMSLIFSAQIAGLLLSGLLANHIGVRQVFTVCAVMLVLLCLAGRLFMEPKSS